MVKVQTKYVVTVKAPGGTLYFISAASLTTLTEEYPDAMQYKKLTDAVRDADNALCLWYGSEVFIHSNYGTAEQETVQRFARKHGV